MHHDDIDISISSCKQSTWLLLLRNGTSMLTAAAAAAAAASNDGATEYRQSQVT